MSDVALEVRFGIQAAEDVRMVTAEQPNTDAMHMSIHQGYRVCSVKALDFGAPQCLQRADAR
jgi:hypothetical protein